MEKLEQRRCKCDLSRRQECERGGAKDEEKDEEKGRKEIERERELVGVETRRGAL